VQHELPFSGAGQSLTKISEANKVDVVSLAAKMRLVDLQGCAIGKFIVFPSKASAD